MANGRLIFLEIDEDGDEVWSSLQRDQDIEATFEEDEDEINIETASECELCLPYKYADKVKHWMRTGQSVVIDAR